MKLNHEFLLIKLTPKNHICIKFASYYLLKLLNFSSVWNARKSISNY